MKKGTIIVMICIVIILLLSICKIEKKTLQDTNPYKLNENDEILEEDINKGRTIRDVNKNEWVWIVVPKSKVFLTAKNNTDYEKIEKDIKEYTKEYTKEGYEDYLEEKEYIQLKQKVLSSIYQYGGFWISRYEIGTTQIRKNKNDNITEPLSQANLYVYNYVTFEKAQEIASSMSNKEYTSNLLFGFQCNLVCKFIEEKGYNKNNEKITKEMIKGNSSMWGNYYSSSFELNQGKYSENNGNSYLNSNNIKEKKPYKNLLLTTGASEQNKICNIYDFAGNVSEWILEYTKEGKKWNILRDGSFYFNYGGNDSMNERYCIENDSVNSSYGFRIMRVKLEY